MECGHCGKIIAGRRGQLNRHMRQCHTLEKPFACPQTGCTKAFKHRYELKKHFASHSNDRMYVCPVCNKRFKLSSTLASHKRTKQACAQVLNRAQPVVEFERDDESGAPLDDPELPCAQDLVSDPFLPLLFGLQESWNYTSIFNSFH